MLRAKSSKISAYPKRKDRFCFSISLPAERIYCTSECNVAGAKAKQIFGKRIEQRAMEKLKMMDIEKLAHKSAYLISGGEKQRVAIARALINDPQIVMCDEPTGNLDKKNGEMVFDVFKQLSAEYNQTLFVVTRSQFCRRHRTCN